MRASPIVPDSPIWGNRRGPRNAGHVETEALRVVGERVIAQTGAEVRGVHRVTRADSELVVVLAGTRLVAARPDGSVAWHRGDLGVTRIVDVLPEEDAVVVIGRRDRVHVVALGDGRTVWSWRHPEGREVAAAGSVRIVPHAGVPLLLVAPGYSTEITCVELAGEPRPRWTHDFAETIDAGFGPVMIAADVLGTGTPQLVISSRTGTGYGGDDVPNERLVLGREDGRVYQAVLDLADGRLLADVAYRPDPGDYPAARPYGLLQAGADAAGDIVLVSCQVEEYAAVTAADGGLRRRWGWFVEKDWPTDTQELRPQTTSVAQVRGDGRPRLVVGHWDGSTWTTLVLDVVGPASDGSRERIPGRYFWGTADLDGDGVPEIITSVESERRPGSRTRLEAVDGRTGRVVAAVDDVAVVTVDDETLPPDRVFHADRRGAATLVDAGGRVGLVLVDAEGRTVWWHPGATRDGAPTVLLDRPVARVDDRPGGRAVAEADGTVHLLGGDLSVTAALVLHGRSPRPLLRRSPDGVEVVVDHAGGRLSAHAADGPRWSARAGSAALCRRADGTDVLVSVDPGADSSAIAIRELGEAEPRLRASWTVPGLVDGVMAYGDGPTVLALRRTGPHTAGVVAFDADGAKLWRDDERGVHANEPLAFGDGRPRVATDDHGVLTVRDGETGVVLAERDWTAAYTTPIEVRLDGRVLLVRADGTHGVELCTVEGDTVWRRGYEIFAVHPGVSVLTGDRDEPLLAVPRRDGVVDVLRLRDGELVRQLPLGDQPERRPLLGLGRILLAGTVAGSLVAIDPADGSERWRREYPAAVEGLAAVTEGDRAWVSVTTADGAVRLLELSRDGR